MDVSIDDLREIARLAVESDLQVFYLEVGDVRMALGKTDAAAPLVFGHLGAAPAAAPAPAASPTPAPAQPAGEPEGTSASTAAPAADLPAGPPPAAGLPAGPPPVARAGLADVTATSLGVVYRRPAPDQPPFVDVGSEVRAGETVCLIEVMKTYNRVEAPCDGRVAEICVADGTMVERGETLMRVEPSRSRD